MKKNKHLEEIRKEITPEIREKVRQFADDKIAKMSKERDYNQLDALKYLVETGPTHINEWTEAGMYDALKGIILEGSKRYTKEHLDKLLEYASNY